MAKHEATVSWSSDGDFLSGKYRRAHHIAFDGGAVMLGSSSPGVVPLPYSDPAGVDPEEMLIASVSACHMLWFLNLAQLAGHDVASYRDEATGVMGKDERGRIAVTRISLAPDIAFNGPAPSATELDALHHEAHHKCFIANSLRTEVVVARRS
jgi:organic hydroperoxide reductase OsmC/OhrA